MSLRREDLRIGNWFLSLDSLGKEEDEWVLRQVTPADLFNPYKFPEFGKPVELTEEWLLKFGFYPHSKGWFSLSKSEFYLAQNPYGFYLVIENKDDETKYQVEELSIKLNLTFIHQLQNLFKCLTGEELSISAEKPLLK